MWEKDRYSMGKVKTIATGYTPRPLQMEIHRNMKRFNVLVLHRRFGKTVLSINEMLDRGLRNPRKNPQYVYLAGTYGQAKRVAWEYVKEFTKGIPGTKANEAELRVDIPRPHLDDKVRLLLLGAENPDSLRGIYIDGCVLDEFGVCDPSVWGEVIRPALADREGWAIFIGTPKGQNHFYNLYNKAKQLEGKDWYVSLHRASETEVIPKAELEAAQAEMSEEEFEQEFECSWTAANVGAYYQKTIAKLEKDNRITSVVYEPKVVVDTAWDLGIGDTTAIWFCQSIGTEYRVIDYLEMSGQGLEWFVKELNKKDYIYGEHFLPHDAKARELGTGKSRVETLRSLGLKRIYVLPRWGVDDGIHAVRSLLPQCWFDEVKCRRGLEALKAYEKKWDGKNQIFMAKPKHNWASHGADAFRYLAQGIRPETQRKDNYGELPRECVMEYDYFSL